MIIVNLLGLISLIGDFGFSVLLFVVLVSYLPIFLSLVIALAFFFVIGKYFRQYYMISYSMNFAGLCTILAIFTGLGHSVLASFSLTTYVIMFAAAKIGLFACRFMIYRDDHNDFYRVDHRAREKGVDGSMFMPVQIILTFMNYMFIAMFVGTEFQSKMNFSEKTFLLTCFGFAVVNILFDYFIIRRIDMKIDGEL